MSNPPFLLTTPPIIPIKTISPTRFISLNLCYLKGVWESNNNPSMLPSSPNAIIGRVIHKIMEHMGEGKIENEESFEGNWNLFVRQEEEKLLNSWFERHLVPLSTSTRNYDEKKELCRLLVKSCVENKTHSNVKQKFLYTTKHELWLQTYDGICVGKVDFLKASDNFVEIVDYKSTETVGPKELNEYGVQLKLYGALYHENYGTWPSSLVIMLTNNKRIEIPFTKEECEGLLNNAKKMFYEVNGIVSKNCETKDLILDLANPSPEICHFCNFRPACTSYWGARKSSPEEPWPSDLKGRTRGKGPWGKSRIYLEIETGNQDTVKVVDLLPDRHPALEVFNSEIAFFSLNKDKKNAKLFHEGQLTVAYSISESTSP